jgi:hypothetical protein
MTFIFQEALHIGDVTYAIDTYPLESYLASLPVRPETRMTPFNRNGYVATWRIVDDTLYLTSVSTAPFARLFAHVPGPVVASWFSGLVLGWRGERRHTGWPPRSFRNEEIVLEIVAGKVAREWVLDLRGVPDQTDDELRLSLPEFLWPPRLRNNE